MTYAALLRHLAAGLGLALLSALVVRAMISLRVMDTPEARKVHDRPTPKGGGVGIVAAFLVGLLLLYYFAEFARLEMSPAAIACAIDGRRHRPPR